MNEKIAPLYKDAMLARYHLKTGQISYDKAIARVRVFTHEANKLASKIAKENGVPFRKIEAAELLR